MKRYQNWILAGTSGVLLVLSYPSFNLFPLAWVGLIPLLVSLKSTSSWKSAFWLGYVTGFIFFLGTIYWIILLYPYANIFLTTFGCVILVAYLAAYLGAFSALLSRIPWQSGLAFIFVASAIWTGLEWVRSWLLTGFPWGSMGYTQWRNLPAIQIASLTGVHGVSFVIVLFNVTLADAIRSYRAWQSQMKKATPLRFVTAYTRVVALPIASVLACFVYGIFALSNPVRATENIKLALVPGNIRQIDKWKGKNFNEIFNRYVDITRSANQAHPDLVVWPETAIPSTILSGPANGYRQKLNQILHDENIYLLTGIPDYMPESQAYYNSVYLLSPSGDQLGSYSKIHLVPFGEYVPLTRYLPDWLTRHIPNFIQLTAGFESGTSIVPLPVPSTENGQMGISICFESVFPNLFRTFVKKGANVMGILTNDAWFEGTAAPEQHLAMAPLRAVENRVAVFRCANGGISCIIDALGRITTTPILPNNTRGFLIGEAPLRDQNKTLYTRYGDWFPVLCFLVSAILIVHQNRTWLLSKVKRQSQKQR